MAAVRKGSQLPSRSFVLPYTKTKGNEAIELYNKTGRTAQEWQELMVYDIMALNDDELWLHQKFGYSVPRRNGKSEILIMVAMWGLLNGLRVLYTAHRTTTSHSAWEKIGRALSKTGLREKEDYKTLAQFGLERIEMLDGSDACICFRTRSSKGGLGEGFDILIIDEAQEYTDDQDTALKYVVTDSKNPMTLYCGTPPTVVSAGTVFQKYRDDVIKGKKEDAGWAEWSVDTMTDQNDVDAWYQTNPSLGTIFTERNVRSEIGSDEIDFNIQRLGLWLKYNQKSAITLTEWKQLEITEKPKLQGMPVIGIKFGYDGLNVALSLACKTSDEKILIDGYDCRPIRSGLDWILAFIKQTGIKEIAVDGESGFEVLESLIKDARIRIKIKKASVNDVISAHTIFEQALEEQSITHFGQPSLQQSATNCEKRAIGTKGGQGYKANKEGVEIALLDSVVLAHWLCKEHKEKRKIRVSY
jgi:Phage terminase-like protein, large subunit